jgi:hypothetical protein
MALAAALAFAIILAGGSVALASHQNSNLEEAQVRPPAIATSAEDNSGSSIFSGVIADSHCGARHVRNSHQSPAECVRACVRDGASYVLIDGERRYTLLGGEIVLDRLVGERVNISGARQGSTIVVSSAAPVTGF